MCHRRSVFLPNLFHFLSFGFLNLNISQNFRYLGIRELGGWEEVMTDVPCLLVID